MALTATGSGLLDHHVLMALRQGWEVLSASKPKFLLLFPGDLTAVAEKWFTALTPADPEKKVSVRLHGTRGVASALSIIVRLENESLYNNPLGEITHVVDHVPIHQMLLSQSVLVEVAAPSPELCRALSVCVRAVLQCGKFSFIKAGYRDFAFASADGLSPEEQFLAEQAGLGGICFRRMRYTAIAHVDIPDLGQTLTDIDWYALRSDLKDVAGDAGGVVPYSG